MRKEKKTIIMVILEILHLLDAKTEMKTKAELMRKQILLHPKLRLSKIVQANLVRQSPVLGL